MGVSFKRVRQFVNANVFRCEEKEQVAQLLNENFPYAKTFVLRVPCPWSNDSSNTVTIDKLKELLNYGGGESVNRNTRMACVSHVGSANRGVKEVETIMRASARQGCESR